MVVDGINLLLELDSGVMWCVLCVVKVDDDDMGIIFGFMLDDFFLIIKRNVDGKWYKVFLIRGWLIEFFVFVWIYIKVVSCVVLLDLFIIEDFWIGKIK